MEKVFKARIACPGRAEGRLTLSPDEEGILVLGKSFPNLLLNPRKVRGIIIREGGVLCHAAVLAREHRIPCVVCRDFPYEKGVVELDAVHGIIKVKEE